jgi:hypothetical protein
MSQRVVLAGVAALTCLLAVACGGSSSGGNPAVNGATTTSAAPANTPDNPTAETTAITKVWTTFFDASTPVAKGRALLEDGDTLGAALKVAQQVREKSGIDQKAKVNGVTFLDPTKAMVNYDLLNGKDVVLPSATGQAVLIDGHWKVSKLTFCTLVQLGAGDKPVPGCS